MAGKKTSARTNTKNTKNTKSSKNTKNTKASKNTKAPKNTKNKKGGAVAKVAKVAKNVPRRYFKAIYKRDDEVVCNGRYRGRKPKQAASKALTAITKGMVEAGEDVNDVSIHFCIMEQTRGSKHKKYYYAGKKHELDEPVIVSITKTVDGKKITQEIKYKKKSVIKKCSSDNCPDLRDYKLKKEEHDDEEDEAEEVAEEPVKQKGGKKNTKKAGKASGKKIGKAAKTTGKKTEKTGKKTGKTGKKAQDKPVRVKGNKSTKGSRSAKSNKKNQKTSK